MATLGDTTATKLSVLTDITEGGTKLSDKYAAKTHTHSDYLPTSGGNYNVTIGAATANSNKTLIVNGKLVVNPSYNTAANSYNEGIRINKASNGWSNVSLGGTAGNTQGSENGLWLVGVRGAAGSVAGAVGDFTIEHNGSTGTGLTLFKDGSRPKWNNNALAYSSDLGTAAAKAFTTSVTQNSTDLVTSGAVWTAIDNLPEPMVFKGGATITKSGTTYTVAVVTPSAIADVKEGYTYKVTSAPSSDANFKAGDTLVANVSNPGTDPTNTAKWTVIPSGDEPSGTVTSVAMTVPTGLSVSGSPITTSGTLAITFADGYSIPTITKQNSWDAKQAALPTTTTAGKVLKSTSTAGTVEWGNDTDTWREIKVGGTQKIANTSSTALDFVNKTTPAAGDVTFAYDSGIKATVTLPTSLKNPNALQINTLALTYDGSNTRTYTFSATPNTNGSLRISDGTNNVDVQLNGAFTDNDHYHTSGTWDGLTYTATAQNGAGALAFTLPTGSTATTVAAGNHNHNSTYLALDGSNTMTGVLNLKATGNNETNIGDNGIRWGTNSLPQDTSPQYFCTIDGFANGGRQKWASLANVKTALGVPTVTNYFWANQNISANSSTETTPTVSTITIGGSGTAAGKATMQYNTTDDCIEFIFA